jgi:hypothetical protein
VRTRRDHRYLEHREESHAEIPAMLGAALRNDKVVALGNSPFNYEGTKGTTVTTDGTKVCSNIYCHSRKTRENILTLMRIMKKMRYFTIFSIHPHMVGVTLAIAM